MLKLVNKEADQSLVFGRKASENVLRNNDSFLHGNRLSVLNNLLDDLNSTTHRTIHFQDDLSDSLDCSGDQVHIHIVGIVMQFVEDALRVPILGNLH